AAQAARPQRERHRLGDEHHRRHGPLDGHRGGGGLMRRSKRMKAALEAVDATRSYGLREAVELLKSTPSAKFDESVDVAVNLGVDPKHADQMVRGGIVRPHGTGKTVRVLVFAKGEKEHEAREAGADYVGAEDLAKKITDVGWLDFDRVIATPDMMGVVGRLGR